MLSTILSANSNSCNGRDGITYRCFRICVMSIRSFIIQMDRTGGIVLRRWIKQSLNGCGNLWMVGTVIGCRNLFAGVRLKVMDAYMIENRNTPKDKEELTFLHSLFTPVFLLDTLLLCISNNEPLSLQCDTLLLCISSNTFHSSVLRRSLLS